MRHCGIRELGSEVKHQPTHSISDRHASTFRNKTETDLVNLSAKHSEVHQSATAAVVDHVTDTDTTLL